jgi:Lsr2
MTESLTATLTDDIDEPTAIETVRFSVDGTAYEIDLSARHARELRSVVGRYISVARRIRSDPSRAPQQHQPGTPTKRGRQHSRRLRATTRKPSSHRLAPDAAQEDLAVAPGTAPVNAEVRADDHVLTGGEKQELRNIADAVEPRRNVVADRLRTKGLVDRDTAGNWWLTNAGRRELTSVRSR